MNFLIMREERPRNKHLRRQKALPSIILSHQASLATDAVSSCMIEGPECRHESVPLKNFGDVIVGSFHDTQLQCHEK